MIVSIAAESSERVLSGLDAGAIDFVQKPTALATEKVFDVAEELVAKVLAAAQAPNRRRLRPAAAEGGASDARRISTIATACSSSVSRPAGPRG